MLKHQPRSRYSDNVKFFPIFNAIKFTLTKKKKKKKQQGECSICFFFGNI